MQPTPEPLPLHIRLVHDAGSIALVAVILVPGYLLLSEYWRSLLLLIGLYLVLALGFIRLGWYVRRVIRRLPAEIPPWQLATRPASVRPETTISYSQREVIESVHRDPQYLHGVLKPRLRQLLAYRLSGSLDVSFEDLDAAQLARVDPDLLDFLARQEATSLWATYRYRDQRLHNILAALQRLESV